MLVGEVGLGGEIRTVSQIESRLKEAAKLGFERAVVPENNLERIAGDYDLDVTGVQQLKGVVDLVL